MCILKLYKKKNCIKKFINLVLFKCIYFILFCLIMIYLENNINIEKRKNRNF